MASPTSKPPAFLCLGGAVVDRKYLIGGAHVAGSSNPAALRVSFGGVARNVAENLARLGVDVALCAAVGADAQGTELVAALAGVGVRTDAIWRMEDAPTAEYTAVLDADGLVLGVAVMDAAAVALEARIGPILQSLAPDTWLFADTNLTAAALSRLIGFAREQGRMLALDAVSVAKAARLPERLDGVGLMVMNAHEARAVLRTDVAAPALAGGLVARGAAAAVVTAGADGAAGATGEGVFHCPAVKASVVDVTGAGDSLVAAVLWQLRRGEPLAEALRWGVAAAALTIGTAATVHPALSADFLAGRVSPKANA